MRKFCLDGGEAWGDERGLYSPPNGKMWIGGILFLPSENFDAWTHD